MSRSYVYCVGPTGLAGEWGSNGIDGARVYAVREGAVAALVSPLVAGRGVPRPTRESLLAHEFVVWAASRERTVLPVAFGTVFRSDADVRASLAAIGGAVSEALAAVDGCVELGVRAVWQGESPAPASVPTVRAIAAIAERSTRSVMPLRPVGERVLLAAALLVPRADAASIVREVRALGSESGGALRVSVTGPWAPYHFGRVRVRADVVPANRDGGAGSGVLDPPGPGA
jgi:hypothetical protein